MSMELIVYLKHSAMPTLSNLQQAIHDAEFPLQLDPDIDLNSHSGFLPCKLRGAESGFEYFVRRLSGSEAAEVGTPSDSNFSVTLVTHSNLQECACAVVAAGVIARVTGGLLVDPQSSESFAATDALGWAKEQFADVERG